MKNTNCTYVPKLTEYNDILKLLKQDGCEEEVFSNLRNDLENILNKYKNHLINDENQLNYIDLISKTTAICYSYSDKRFCLKVKGFIQFPKDFSFVYPYKNQYSTNKFGEYFLDKNMAKSGSDVAILSCKNINIIKLILENDKQDKVVNLLKNKLSKELRRESLSQKELNENRIGSLIRDCKVNLYQLLEDDYCKNIFEEFIKKNLSFDLYSKVISRHNSNDNRPEFSDALDPLHLRLLLTNKKAAEVVSAVSLELEEKPSNNFDVFSEFLRLFC